MTMPLTFIELCQRTASECSTSLTGPSATAAQTGRLGQIVNWVNTACNEIEAEYNDWRFMVGSFTVNTTADDGQYAYTDCTDTTTGVAIAAFRDWRRDTFKAYLTSAGADTETDLAYLDYRDWYARFNTGAQSSSYPGYFSIANDLSFLLGPKPGGVYTIRGEYQKAATDMSGDSDTPSLPAEYRMAIVYRAMMKYGRYNGAPEVYTDGQNEYKRIMREMVRTQRPADLIGGPLA